MNDGSDQEQHGLPQGGISPEVPESVDLSQDAAALAGTMGGPPVSHDPYLALRYRDFRLLLAGSFVASFGQQMAMVALGWELYNRTGSALVLGGIGLALVLPLVVFTLPAGQAADRFSRRLVATVAQTALAASSLGLAALSYGHGSLALIYACLMLMGSAGCFANPATSALLAQVVPDEAFENATTWRSSTMQLSAVLGPAAGGFLVGLFGGAFWVYVLNALAAFGYVAMLRAMTVQRRQTTLGRGATLHSLLEGIAFLGRTPVLLAAITLDLFAVLLGGATTLLPIYARDILHVGPTGLGWLQASSSVGAVCTALLLAHRPPFRRAGRTLLLSVAAFGLATIVFGISRSFALSLAMLFLLGAFDNVSVVIRSTLVLVRTPDEMRGRVGAVNSLFIGTSNQLGGFESGAAAQLFGPVVSVVAGGIGTVLVVALIAWYWPQMRNLKTLRDAEG